MVSWPELGARVTVRYRRPAGSVPPLTDVIGNVLEIGPTVRIATNSGEVVEVAPDDVVATRLLSDKPVRASEIRALEHADALAVPEVERQWLDGWLLRAGTDDRLASNSAVPLSISANQSAIPAIIDWYRSRDLVPRLAVPERLLRIPDKGEHANRVMVCDADPASDTEQSEAVIADAPDGTRWVRLARIDHSCAAQLAWGASQGATRGYVRLAEGDRPSAELARSRGFVLHHHARYITLT
ncbi:GNAT family N-acetyltransferase, cg3035/Rv0428c family [Mycobacterium paraterrae]|uniref:GNAT family N-acetyltransferase n=1 Tax=Mycobacterium paraterrae TaxID=577492 RepID=A0ABY3VKI8_9MYCO|nr:GNAT family N-acetyltransferase [Mycobacterium paraterrae]UMB68977.1 GNAT family N-acetyltransferase [Mycobacterium paraterrae]